MKKILSLLALTATIAMATTNSSTALKDSENINILTDAQTVIRETRSSREARTNREIRGMRVLKIENTTYIPSLPIARVNRKIRENRLVLQITRENRKVRHLLIEDKLHFASLK